LRPVIFPKAGKIVLCQFQSDGTLDLTDASKWIGSNGTVEKMETSVDIQSTELPDGNSDWAMGVYDTKRDGTVKVTMSSYQSKIYAALMGETIDAESAEKMWSADEEKTIPAASAFEVTLDHDVASGGTIIVLNNDGSPLVSASSGPAADEYTVSGDTLTFNSVDANKAIFVTYEYATVTSELLALPSSGRRPAVHCIISSLATSDDEITEFPLNIVIDKAKASGAMSPPPLQRQPAPWSFDLKVLKPRGGYNPIYWRYKLS